MSSPKNFFTGISIVALSLLTSCSTSSRLDRAVNGYLGELKRDPMSNGGKHHCIKDPIKNSVLPMNIQKWEITDYERMSDEDYPDSQYDVVYVKITERANAGFDVTNTWKASVWKSDELFEAQKRLFSDTDRLIENMRRTVDEANKILGKPSSPEPSPVSTPPDRSTITSEQYCVTRIER